MNADLIVTLTATTDRIAARLDAIEETIEQLPGYGKGVTDGVQTRAEALDDEH